MELETHHKTKCFKQESSVDAKTMGEGSMRHWIFTQFQSISHKTLINYKGKKE